MDSKLSFKLKELDEGYQKEVTMKLDQVLSEVERKKAQEIQQIEFNYKQKLEKQEEETEKFKAESNLFAVRY